LLSLYIHFPFCRSRCSYCDFHTHAGREQDIERYVAVLEREIALKSCSAKVVSEELSSIYLGGGTPSLMTPPQLTRLTECIFESFSIASECEVSVEVNPESASEELLTRAKSIGVNRVSIGAQSFVPEVLKTLGRIHSVEDSERAYCLARAAGFQNISIDLIFGAPGETIPDWRKTLDQALKLSPEHISVYSLTLEPEVPMSSMIEKGVLPALDNDLAAEMFCLGIQNLKQAGYEHYEISNFAKPGCKCRHNWNYWCNGQYLGIGCGAYSYVSGERFRNTNDIDEYLEDSFSERHDLQIRTPESGAAEDLLLGLRRIGVGVSLKNYEQDTTESILSKLEEPMKEGLVERVDATIKLTEKGILFADEVLVSLL